MQVKHSHFSFVRMNFALSGFFLPVFSSNESEQIRLEPDFSDRCYDVSLLGTGINGKIGGYNGTGSVFSHSLEANPKSSTFSQDISTILREMSQTVITSNFISDQQSRNRGVSVY